MKLQKFLLKLDPVYSLLGIAGSLFILAAALFYQFVYHEQPCPLCLLQRAAFLNIALTLLLNLRYPSAQCWVLVILSAVAGIAVSIRQILLHITDPIGFGSPVLGLHMYSWGFIGFTVAIIGSSVFLLIKLQSNNNS